MPPPWSETPSRVVIEFLRSADGADRAIRLSHKKEVVPPQLIGRIDPNFWFAFMTEAEQVVAIHPYTSGSGGNGDTSCDWLPCQNCCLCRILFGFTDLDPQHPKYRQWLPYFDQLIQRYRPGFAQVGCGLQQGSVHGNLWIEINIGVVQGSPVAAMPMVPSPIILM